MDVGWVLPVCWLSLGVIVVGCSVGAARSRRAAGLGIAGVAALWVLAGAGANLLFLIRGEDFSGFADQASTSFVRDTWESLVVPHHAVFIGLLIVFEAGAGAAVLVATHDLAQALQLASRVLVLAGTPATLAADMPVPANSDAATRAALQADLAARFPFFSANGNGLPPVP